MDRRFDVAYIAVDAYFEALNVTDHTNGEEYVYNMDYTQRGTVTELPFVAVSGSGWICEARARGLGRGRARANPHVCARQGSWQCAPSPPKPSRERPSGRHLQHVCSSHRDAGSRAARVTALCFRQHSGHRHSIVRTPPGSSLRVRRQPDAALMSVTESSRFVFGCSAAQTIQCVRSDIRSAPCDGSYKRTQNSKASAVQKVIHFQPLARPVAVSSLNAGCSRTTPPRCAPRGSSSPTARRP
jgi:hypothetical protein